MVEGGVTFDLQPSTFNLYFIPEPGTGTACSS
jgi:hypothetical protein